MKTKILIVSLLASLNIYSAEKSADSVLSLWQAQCQKCHGANGAGDTKIGQKLKLKNYTDPKVQESLKDDDIINAITNGVKLEGTDKQKMPPYSDKLTPEQTKELATLIRTFKKT